ncbi:MAG: hypothetical protein HYY06_13670 [Deltaproteobacteria bacterium]|nr:hypothetical protein [Deltaproteobacteria bacterium]
MRGILVLWGLIAIPSVSAASTPLVTVGEMGGSGETRALLRRLLIQELGASLGASTAPGGARFELQGTITRLVRLPDPTQIVLSCEVSLILVERPGGSVRAFLSGSSHLNGGPSRRVEARGDARETAIRIAIRGALRRLPAALGSLDR